MIAIFCGKLRASEAPTVFGDGTQTRDYIYVGDVVEAALAAAAGDASGAFNVGTGRETSVLELVEAAARAGRRGRLRARVRPAARGRGAADRAGLLTRRRRAGLAGADRAAPGPGADAGIRLAAWRGPLGRRRAEGGRRALRRNLERVEQVADVGAGLEGERVGLGLAADRPCRRRRSRRARARAAPAAARSRSCRAAARSPRRAAPRPRASSPRLRAMPASVNSGSTLSGLSSCARSASAAASRSEPSPASRSASSRFVSASDGSAADATSSTAASGAGDGEHRRCRAAGRRRGGRAGSGAAATPTATRAGIVTAGISQSQSTSE